MSETGFRAALLLFCLLMFALTFAALLWAAWHHHRADKTGGANFHSSLWVEISWTIVPCVIVLVLIWPTVRVFWVG
jgi:cytochrome c oxidase subunit 2